jgi:hypothetical protein
MTLTVNLRAEADAEGQRLRSIKARTPTRLLPDGMLTSVLRRRDARSFHLPAAIFLTRTRIVDGAGRLVEDVFVPIEVRGATVARHQRRREMARAAQALFDDSRALVRAACLEEVARRLSDLGSIYNRGLARARARESQVAALADAERRAMVQPGLFDDRATAHREPVDGLWRQETLDRAASPLVAQQSQAVLMLLVGAAA